MKNRDAHAVPWWRSRAGFVLLLFLLVGGFFLWTEHRAHLLGWWPYLLALLACGLALWLLLSPSERR